MTSRSAGKQGSQPLVGSQTPRLFSFPKYASTAGHEAIEVAELAGLELDEWQQYSIIHSLGERPDGKWAAPDVCEVVSRQNGKGSVLAARELAGLFLLGEEVIIHSAHQQATASEQFRRLLNLIEGVPEFDRRVSKAPKGKGNEAIELFGGQRVFFKTRTGGGGRGFSCDCLIYDEAMILPEEFVAATSPTLAARSLTTRTGVQTWFTGSAVDQQTMEHGMVFARVRELGLKGDPNVAFFEWSADPGTESAGDPGRVPIEVLRDRKRWAQANPGLGIRIAEDYVERELGKLGTRAFAVERLSIGDWPNPNLETKKPLTVAKWAELLDGSSAMAATGVIAFDVAPDRSMSTIAGAGLRADGKTHVGVIDRRPRMNWLPAALAELKEDLKPLAIVADASGPVAALLPDIEALGIEVVLTSAKDYAAACQMFADDVDEHQIAHVDEPDMVTAIGGVETSPLADGWKWSRRGSGAVDISPLVACTLANWGVATQSTQFATLIALDDEPQGHAPERGPQALVLSQEDVTVSALGCGHLPFEGCTCPGRAR